MNRNSASLESLIEGHSFKTMLKTLKTTCLPISPCSIYGGGGLTIAFANMTSVESYFSILKFEKDAYRTCLMDLSVE